MYEMVTGQLPLLRSVSIGDVPVELERIIYKALEKDRNLRYQSAAEIRTDLQRFKRDTSMRNVVRAPSPAITTGGRRARATLLMAVIALLLIVGTIFYFKNRSKPVAAGKTAIAVVPFSDLSAE